MPGPTGIRVHVEVSKPQKKETKTGSRNLRWYRQPTIRKKNTAAHAPNAHASLTWYLSVIRKALPPVILGQGGSGLEFAFAPEHGGIGPATSGSLGELGNWSYHRFEGGGNWTFTPAGGNFVGSVAANNGLRPFAATRAPLCRAIQTPPLSRHPTLAEFCAEFPLTRLPRRVPRGSVLNPQHQQEPFLPSENPCLWTLLLKDDAILKLEFVRDGGIGR
jgi:hypothetical protein